MTNDGTMNTKDNNGTDGYDNNDGIKTMEKPRPRYE